jgi:hypothetical protein
LNLFYKNNEKYKMYQATKAMNTNQQRSRAYRKLKSNESLAVKNNYDVVEKSMGDSSYNLEEVSELYEAVTGYKAKINKYNVDHDALPTHQYLDYLEAGGNAAVAWCSSILQKQNVIKAYKSTTDENLLNAEANTPDVDNWSKVEVTKSVDQELMQATFVALAPDEYDLHNDIYSIDEVRKACHNFNQFCGVANLLHLIETSSFSIVESYISPVDMVLGETIVKSGSWLTVLQFHSEELWQDVKAGNFTGVSIGARAFVHDIPDEDLE